MGRLTVRVAAGGVGGGLAYGVLLGHRSDYLGHFAAGFGATLVLLGVPLLIPGARLGWTKIAITAAAIAAGVVTESTVFRLAIFDPVDVCNQSLGACIACACALERRGGPLTAVAAFALGVAGLGAGFHYAFA